MALLLRTLVEAIVRCCCIVYHNSQLQMSQSKQPT